MQVTVKGSDPSQTRADVLIVPVHSGANSRGKEATPRLPASIKTLDRALGGVMAAAITSGDFEGKAGQTAVLYPPGKHVQRVVLVGVGKQGALTTEGLRRAAGSAIRRVAAKGRKRVSFWLPNVPRVDATLAAQAVTEGVVLGAYVFDAYRQKRGTAMSGLTLFSDGSALPAIRRGTRTGLVLAESQNLARDLSNEPGNALPPSALAAAARRVARDVGLRCEIMDVAELKRRKMGGILAVGGGSARPPRLVVMEHRANKRGARKRPTICLVGKGVTFDSGGISIKPSANMEEMKHDMSGAAAVVGAMRAVALLDLPLHVVGIIGAAENMPSATAYRPGDIVRTASGKTIEILNTDAEGRVVLADALHYAREEFKPDAMIDLATLTGACMIALGPWATGLLGTDEGLIEKVRKAGDLCGEIAWPLPLFNEHRAAMRSSVADLKNTGGRDAGVSTAAGFLAAFAGDTPWVHLDIAGTGWVRSAGPYQPRGGTGVGVRLLLELLRGWK